MKVFGLLLLLIVLTFSFCSPKKSSLVGIWKLKERKEVCSNELLQGEFGSEQNTLDGETTIEFLANGTFKKTTTGSKYFSVDDNVSGEYIFQDSLLYLKAEKILIRDISENNFSLVFKNSVTREVAPTGHCDLYHIYEKQ